MGESESGIASLNFTNSASSAPTIYADHCIYASRFQSSVRLSFIESIMTPQSTPDPGMGTKYSCHVVIPREGFANMVAYLNQMLAAWEAFDAAQE